MAKLGSLWTASSSRAAAAVVSRLSIFSRACWKRARAGFDEVVIVSSPVFVWARSVAGAKSSANAAAAATERRNESVLFISYNRL